MKVYYQTSGRRNWSNLLEARIRLKEKERKKGEKERERKRERVKERERGGGGERRGEREDKHVTRGLLIVPVPLLV